MGDPASLREGSKRLNPCKLLSLLNMMKVNKR